MKEEEARQKLCPFMRHRIADEAGITVNVSSSCIASDCMMWRTYTVEAPLPGRPSFIRPGDESFIEVHGYCRHFRTAQETG